MATAKIKEVEIHCAGFHVQGHRYMATDQDKFILINHNKDIYAIPYGLTDGMSLTCITFCAFSHHCSLVRQKYSLKNFFFTI